MDAGAAGNIIYEVTLAVDAEAAEGLDAWLAAHVARVLAQPGFLDADTLALDTDDGRVARVVRYRLADRASLDEYLAGPAAELRAETAERFGECFAASRRVLAAGGAQVEAAPRCLNCDAVLLGQYCGQCGQRAESRLISVWELLRDAFGDIFDVDSRVWQTVRQLALRPGRLTRDYLSGRRARYMPPFRTYLVLSLVFFAVAFFDPREDFGILFEPPAETVEEAPPAPGDAPRPGVVADPGVNDESQEPAEEKDSGVTLTIDGEEFDADCDVSGYDPNDLPAWLGRRLTPERMKAMCERMTAGDGAGLRGFLDRLLEYVPIGLFVLLPVMALVLKGLYPLSRRYYVEHLLLVVHFHSFVFLALTLQVLVSRLGAALTATDLLETVAVTGLTIYIPVYLYKSLRRVYAQGHLFTTVKYVLLIGSYFVGLGLILGVAALVAAFAE